MLTIAQVDLFQAQLQTKMLEVALEQAKAELNDDRDCAKVHQCTYRFLSIYFAVFTNPLYNYTMAQTEAMILWISAVTSLNEVVPVSFTDFTVINTGTDHTHSISQIIGLQAALDNLQAQIDDLEDTQITEIDGGNANTHDPNIPGSGILIVLRNDNTVNWESLNPILQLGEMGFAIDNNVVIGGKMGIGSRWSETPYHFSPFVPIVTDNGRNLDAPWSPYNAQHNFQTETEAWNYVLNPYSEPYITFPNGGLIADVEVGNTVGQDLNSIYDYTFTVFNTDSILREDNDKKLYYVSTIDTPVTPEEIANSEVVGYPLENQQDPIVGQEHTATLFVNRNDAGSETVFSAYIRGKINPELPSSVYGASAYVRFRLLSTAFLWKAKPNGDGTYSSELLDGTYNDEELSDIIKTMNVKQQGLVYPIMGDGEGTKDFVAVHGLIPFNSSVFNPDNPPPAAVDANGVFNIVIAIPAGLGTPYVYGANSTTAITLFEPCIFEYANGTAHTTYEIHVVKDVISGPMPVNIK